MGVQNFSRGGRSFRGGGGFRGGRGGGRFSNFNDGPPESVIEVGSLLHPCQEDIVCKLTAENIPYSNAPVYLQNKEQIGKVDEIFGQIKNALTDTVKSKSFKEGSKFYMDPARFLTLDRILNPTTRGGGRGRSRGGSFPTRGQGRGDFRGGRGDFRGRSNNRGNFRGRSSNDRGDFRGGFRGSRGNFGNRNDLFRSRGNDRPSFSGKREFNNKFNSSPQVKKFKSED